MSELLSKNKIKYLRSLKLSKFRQMYNNFVVEGEKMAIELLSDSNIEIENIVCTVNWYENHGNILRPFDRQILIAKPKEMEQISFLKTSTQVFVVVKQLKQAISKDQIAQNLSLYLDNIQNPGNLGTILRIADWFGIRTVFCSLDTVDLYNPKVVQSTMGAFLRVKVVKIDFSQLIKDFPQLPVYGMVLEGDDLFKKDLSPQGLIVIGSEGQGISAPIKKQLTHPVAIPAHPDGGAESLNAAVATGIVCAVFRGMN